MDSAKTVEYQDDDGNWCYALVRSSDSEKLNLIYKAHVGGGWEVANDVDRNGKRVR